MQPTGISPGLVRLLTTTAPDLITELFTPGRVLEADVVSVFRDKAVLAFGRGVRLEVTLQAPLQEGQRVRVQVQPQNQATAPPQPQAQPTVASQAQAQAPAQPGAQPAQAGAQPAQPGAQPSQPAPAPVVLKVIGTVQPPAPAETQAAAALPAQPAPVANQPAAPQPGMPQVLWLPIPLPDGNQGWAQIHVQEDDSPKTRAQRGAPVQQVRIWWETPALGPVQVSLESAPASLAALFTAAAADSKGALDRSLHELQGRLAQVGFPDARLGCRMAPPGEAVEPARIEGGGRLDKRL